MCGIGILKLQPCSRGCLYHKINLEKLWQSMPTIRSDMIPSLMNGIVVECGTQKCRKTSGTRVNATFLIVGEHLTHLLHLETGNLPVEIIQDDIAETTILNLLRLHFGFVPPLPLPEITANPSLDDCRNPQLLIDALGLISITASAPFFQKPLLQICIQFVQNFLANQSKKPYDDEWDLSPFNRLSLASCSRLEKVRPVKKNDGSNFRMYMFDFGDEATVPWNLAVCSSTMVLYICRLDGEMRERDIALELLRFGLPFRTFQRADTFADISEAHSLADKTLFPITTSSDTLACNWYKYKEHRHSILQQSRCARAALQAGGFVWRITRDEVDINEALAGPSGRYTNSGFTLSVWDDQGIEYVDDKLTTSETGVILGHYRGISSV